MQGDQRPGMSPGHVLHVGVLQADRFLAPFQLACGERRGGLVSLYFHSLFTSREEAQNGVLSPQQATTVDDFASCIEAFLAKDYRVVTPGEIVRGVSSNQRSLLVTFDDGYYNNLRALPVLEKLGVNATFFISANHVRLGKAFWWDPLYRFRRKEGRTQREIETELAMLNLRPTPEIEQRVTGVAGPDCLVPLGDLDRPFTPGELREFARHPGVTIGNHTCNHAVLGDYPPEGVRRELEEAQAQLAEMTGQTPLAVAYPNGVHNAEICATAKRAGLQLGFTTEPVKEYLPASLRGERALRLGRFCPLGGANPARQCAHFRSDLMLSARFSRLKKALRAAH
jgi:peptidoglycan/xylan/chitin deacetylase (PgdA/CDA1 family)